MWRRAPQSQSSSSLARLRARPCGVLPRRRIAAYEDSLTRAAVAEVRARPGAQRADSLQALCACAHAPVQKELRTFHDRVLRRHTSTDSGQHGSTGVRAGQGAGAAPSNVRSAGAGASAQDAEQVALTAAAEVAAGPSWVMAMAVRRSVGPGAGIDTRSSCRCLERQHNQPPCAEEELARPSLGRRPSLPPLLDRSRWRMRARRGRLRRAASQARPTSDPEPPGDRLVVFGVPGLGMELNRACWHTTFVLSRGRNRATNREWGVTGTSLSKHISPGSSGSGAWRVCGRGPGFRARAPSRASAELSRARRQASARHQHDTNDSSNIGTAHEAMQKAAPRCFVHADRGARQVRRSHPVKSQGLGPGADVW